MDLATVQEPRETKSIFETKLENLVNSPYNGKTQIVSTRIPAESNKCRDIVFGTRNYFFPEKVKKMTMHLDINPSDNERKITKTEYDQKFNIEYSFSILNIDGPDKGGLLSAKTMKDLKERLIENKSNNHSLRFSYDGLDYWVQTHITRDSYKNLGVNLMLVRGENYNEFPMGFLGAVTIKDLTNFSEIGETGRKNEKNDTEQYFRPLTHKRKPDGTTHYEFILGAKGSQKNAAERKFKEIFKEIETDSCLLKRTIPVTSNWKAYKGSCEKLEFK